MPTILVEGPKVVDLDKKREFIARVTEAASELFELPEEVMIVLLKENAPENVGIGGELLLDRHREKEG